MPAAPLVVALTGPTGSGKSACALQVIQLLAQRGLPVEIVSVDSAQVYRGMDIGTAKPTPVQRACVPHHLIDVAEPDRLFSAADFAEAADESISAIIGRGKRVIVAGLDQDYRGRPFGPVPALMAIAEYVTKLHAVCARCGAEASRSQRLVAQEAQLFVGGAAAYEARCRDCFVDEAVTTE